MVGVHRTAPRSSRDSIYQHHGGTRSRRTYDFICLWLSDHDIRGSRLLLQSAITHETNCITSSGWQAAFSSSTTPLNHLNLAAAITKTFGHK